MSRTFTGSSGNRLVASEIGLAGRPILLLHGGGQTRHAWGGTARRLAGAGFHAVTLDQRGHGDSAWPDDGAYTYDDFAADATLVGRRIAAERGRKPVAIGASLGGLASLLSLEPGGEAPFDGLILVDVVPKMDGRGLDRIQSFMRAKAADGFARVEEAAEAVAAYLPHRPRPPSFDGLQKNLRRHADGRWRWHWDPRLIDGPRSVNADAARHYARMGALAPGLAVPTLLVRGGSSELVTPEAAQAFVKTVPDAEYVDVAGARHMVAGDRNDVFAAAILPFLDRRFGD